MFANRSVLVAAVVAMGCGLIGAPTANASNLDDGFLKGGTAAKIRNYLQEQKYTNVGILRFEVKKGKAAPSMNVGKMNSLIATRLENALIYVNDAEKPIGITRGAGPFAASKDKTANWHNAEGRAQLFALKYPLAWGSTPVLVDAFLTGTVEVSADFKETKITIKVFDKKNPELRTIATPLIVKTDRDALREMGEGFVIAKRSLDLLAKKGSVPESEVDDKVTTLVTTPAETAKDIKEYLDIQILVDDAPSEIKTEGDIAVIDTPAPDQKVLIKLTAKVQLGLLLKVNGVNTLNKERDGRDRMESSWWVLDAGKEYTIRGFYKDGMVYPFKVVGEADVDISELGDKQEKHGIISFEVFNTSAVAVVGGGEPRILSRKTANLTRVATRSTTLKGLQNNIKSNLYSVAKRSATIVSDSTGGTSSLESADFQGVFVASFDIRYRP